MVIALADAVVDKGAVMIVSQHTLVAVRTVGASWWSDDLASPAPLVSPHGSGLHHASLLSVDTSHLFKEPNKPW